LRMRILRLAPQFTSPTLDPGARREQARMPKSCIPTYCVRLPPCQWKTAEKIKSKSLRNPQIPTFTQRPISIFGLRAGFAKLIKIVDDAVGRAFAPDYCNPAFGFGCGFRPNYLKMIFLYLDISLV